MGGREVDYFLDKSYPGQKTSGISDERVVSGLVCNWIIEGGWEEESTLPFSSEK